MDNKLCMGGDEMTKLVYRLIQVEAGGIGEPREFQDGEVSHQIQTVIDHWIEMGEWWNGEGNKQLWRVWTHQGGLFDLECSADARWFIYRVWD